MDVYGQMGREGMPRDRAIHTTMLEMFVKVLSWPACLLAGSAHSLHVSPRICSRPWERGRIHGPAWLPRSAAMLWCRPLVSSWQRHALSCCSAP